MILRLFKRYNKHITFLIYLILFIFLFIYAKQYFFQIVDVFDQINASYYFMSLISLILVYISYVVRWDMSMRIFGISLNKAALYKIVLVSNLYKYIPPKGINYLMRMKLSREANVSLKPPAIASIWEFTIELLLALMVSTLTFTLIINRSLFVPIILAFLTLFFVLIVLSPGVMEFFFVKIFDAIP